MSHLFFEIREWSQFPLDKPNAACLTMTPGQRSGTQTSCTLDGFLVNLSSASLRHLSWMMNVKTMGCHIESETMVHSLPFQF